MKQQKFLVSDFPTLSALRNHLQTPIKLLNEGEQEPVPKVFGQLPTSLRGTPKRQYSCRFTSP
jgi:hypothetical protein